MLIIKRLNLERIADKQPLFSSLSVSIKAGQVIALRGSSGSGKTSLLRCFAGLDARAKGILLFNKKEIQGNDMPAFRSKVIYLPQAPLRSSQNALASLQEAFHFSQQPRSFDLKECQSVCEALLLRKALFGQKLTELSGGEIQRFSLARALLLHPSILLLDEPVSGLDNKAREAVALTLKKWSKEKNRAMLICTHQPQWIASQLTHQWVIDNGTLTCNRTPP